ncbi:MAG TPA: DUF2267 domain-containing protein [Polyangia bacterium]|nr:DUF2267 domain-containing protein [Polyangia bacterium]
MNLFAKMNQQATLWIKDMMAELGTTDGHKAMHALRAGLQSLRDRLSVDQAAQLSAQLPLIIRGMFFEGWDPSGTPLRIRHRAEFLALVRDKYAPREDLAAEDILRSLFRVLDRHIAAGEVGHLMVTLPEDLTAIIGGRDLAENLDA